MRPLRLKFEVLLLWLPLLVLLLCSAAAGHSIKSYTQLPVALSPIAFLAGVALMAGALIGFFQPVGLKDWLSPTSTPTASKVSQYLFSLIFGAVVIGTAVMAILA